MHEHDTHVGLVSFNSRFYSIWKHFYLIQIARASHSEGNSQISIIME